MLISLVLVDPYQSPDLVGDVPHHVGGGVAIPLSECYSIEIGIQYRAGLKDVFNHSIRGEPKPENPGETVIKFGALAVQVGFRVPLMW